MDLAGTVTVTVVVLFLIGSAYSQTIVTPPVDATSLRGGTASFVCEVQFGPIEEMTWEFNGNNIYCYLDGTGVYSLGSSKYSVETNGHRFTLTIKDLGLPDGGKYKCTAFIPSATSVLLVLDTPVITSQPSNPNDGDLVTLTCEARYGGPPKDSISPDNFPQLKMFSEDSQIKQAFQASEIDSIAEDHLLSVTRHLTVDSIMHEKQVTCELQTTFPAMKTTTNKMLKVLYAVHGITFRPNHPKYEVGSNITCNANGNPAPIYEWRNLTQEIQSGVDSSQLPRAC